MGYKKGQYVWVKGTVRDDGDVVFRDGAGGFIEYIRRADLHRLDIQTDDKVTIPKFVAKKIEYCKTEDYSLFHAMDYCFQYSDTADWLECNENIFARAWFDGYQIEQEKLYTVEIPNPLSIYPVVLGKNDDGGVILGVCFNFNKWKESRQYQLTKEEIKKDFEWAWEQGFAKEVE